METGRKFFRMQSVEEYAVGIEFNK